MAYNQHGQPVVGAGGKINLVQETKRLTQGLQLTSQELALVSQSLQDGYHGKEIIRCLEQLKKPTYAEMKRLLEHHRLDQEQANLDALSSNGPPDLSAPDGGEDPESKRIRKELLSACFYSANTKYQQKLKQLEANGPLPINFAWAAVSYQGDRDATRKANGDGKLLIYRTEKRSSLLGEYVGQFFNGDLHGHGELKFTSGVVFRGIFYHNKLHEAELVDPKQNVYTGKLKNFRKNGVGTMVYSNGSRYEGHWQDNMKNGFGRLWYYQGDYCEGFFHRERLHGFAMYTQNTGDLFAGWWMRNRKHRGLVYFKSQRRLVIKEWSLATNKAFRQTPLTIDDGDSLPDGVEWPPALVTAAANNFVNANFEEMRDFVAAFFEAEEREHLCAAQQQALDFHLPVGRRRRVVGELGDAASRWADVQRELDEKMLELLVQRRDCAGLTIADMPVVHPVNASSTVRQLMRLPYPFKRHTVPTAKNVRTGTYSKPPGMPRIEIVACFSEFALLHRDELCAWVKRREAKGASYPGATAPEKNKAAAADLVSSLLTTVLEVGMSFGVDLVVSEAQLQNSEATFRAVYSSGHHKHLQLLSLSHTLTSARSLELAHTMQSLRYLYLDGCSKLFAGGERSGTMNEAPSIFSFLGSKGGGLPSLVLLSCVGSDARLDSTWLRKAEEVFPGLRLGYMTWHLGERIVGLTEDLFHSMKEPRFLACGHLLDMLHWRLAEDRQAALDPSCVDTATVTCALCRATCAHSDTLAVQPLITALERVVAPSDEQHNSSRSESAAGADCHWKTTIVDALRQPIDDDALLYHACGMFYNRSSLRQLYFSSTPAPAADKRAAGDSLADLRKALCDSTAHQCTGCLQPFLAPRTLVVSPAASAGFNKTNNNNNNNDNNNNNNAEPIHEDLVNAFRAMKPAAATTAAAAAASSPSAPPPSDVGAPVDTQSHAPSSRLPADQPPGKDWE